MRKFKLILLIFSSILITLTVSFFVYVNIYYHAEEEALEILELRSDIIFDNDVIVIPSTQQSDVGFIFYPGAKVESKSYLPLLNMISQNGINVYLVTMPFNLAIFGVNKAQYVLDNYENNEWYMGGHSMGGAFASVFAEENQNIIKGLILLGAYVYGDYPEEKTAVIYGEFDTILSKIDEKTNVFMIKGGNHGYFGNYPDQKGDSVATITKCTQQEQTTNILVDFLKK